MLGFLRNRAVVVLLLLLVAGVAIGMLHNQATESGHPFAIQDVVTTILAPGSRAIHTISALGNQAVRTFRPRYAILRENERLRKELVTLTRENAGLREAAGENVQLRAALKLRESTPLRMKAAEVISRNASTWFDTATIDCGRWAGVKPGSAVISQRGGLVGQVLSVSSMTSQVVAITDQNSAVGAMVQRSRIAGILQGQGANHVVLSYLPKDADVKANDVVVSSGMGRVVPKGFVIGRITRVVRNSIAGTTSALVRPSVSLGAVEHVFVIEPGQAVPE